MPSQSGEFYLGKNVLTVSLAAAVALGATACNNGAPSNKQAPVSRELAVAPPRSGVIRTEGGEAAQVYIKFDSKEMANHRIPNGAPVHADCIGDGEVRIIAPNSPNNVFYEIPQSVFEPDPGVTVPPCK